MCRHGCRVDHYRMVIVDVPPKTDPPPTLGNGADGWSRVFGEGATGVSLPASAPRCKVCNNPFGGPAGRLLAVAGFSPSRKNPNLCSRCCDSLPAGGAEVDVAVLFADVRGSTALGQSGGAADFAALLNR